MEQLIQDLVTRAQAVVASSKKDYTEMGAVHQAITGTGYDCTPCNERRILFTLQSFIAHPERYALRIQETLTEMEEVTKSKYRFSKKATSDTIVLVTAHGTVLVTPQNLTDDKAELVLAHKQFAHNIEQIEEVQVKAVRKKAAPKKSASKV